MKNAFASTGNDTPRGTMLGVPPVLFCNSCIACRLEEPLPACFQGSQTRLPTQLTQQNLATKWIYISDEV